MSCGIGLALAEESAQAAWAQGWERRDQLCNPACLLSRINTIALNLCRNQLRRRESDELPSDIPAPPQRSDRARIDVGRALAGCTPAERKVIEGRYWAGYTSLELAADSVLHAGGGPHPADASPAPNSGKVARLGERPLSSHRSR